MSIPQPDIAQIGRRDEGERADIRRRRLVAVAAIVIGSGLIAATLNVERGSSTFYLAGYALASVWIVAALVCPPIDLRGSLGTPRELALGVAGGVATYGVFVAAAVIGRHFTLLAGPIDSLLARADAGSVVAVLSLALVNGVGEELFFRDTLTRAVGTRYPYVIATIVYVAVTAVGGNTALTLAAIVMGAVFALARKYTGGLVAPIAVHLVWTTLVVLALPR